MAGGGRRPRPRRRPVRQDRQRSGRTPGLAQGHPGHDLSPPGHRPRDHARRRPGPAHAGHPRRRGHRRSAWREADRLRPSGKRSKPWRPWNPTSTRIRTSGRPTWPITRWRPGFTVADMQPRSFTAEELLAICRPGRGRAGQPDPDELLRVRQPLHARHDQAVPRAVRRDGDRRPAGGRPGAGDAGPGEAGRPRLPHPAAIQQAAPGAMARAAGLRGDVRHRRADRPGAVVPDRSRRLPRGQPDVRPIPRDPGHHRPSRTDRRRARTGRSATPTSRRSARWPGTPTSS